MRGNDLDQAVKADLTRLLESRVIFEPRTDWTALERPPVIRPDPETLMMTIDIEATTCLLLNAQGFDPIPLYLSQASITKRCAELGPTDREIFDHMALSASRMNSGAAASTFVLNDKVFETKGGNSAPALNVPAIEFLLERFPEPDETTPWERIIEFREDSDSVKKLARLRRWLRGIAKNDLPGEVAADQLEGMLADYEEHMQLHGMKTEIGTLETLIVAAEHLAKLRVGELSKLLSARRRKIALLEAELNAPGREIAYVAKVRKEFG